MISLGSMLASVLNPHFLFFFKENFIFILFFFKCHLIVPWYIMLSPMTSCLPDLWPLWLLSCFLCLPRKHPTPTQPGWVSPFECTSLICSITRSNGRLNNYHNFGVVMNNVLRYLKQLNMTRKYLQFATKTGPAHITVLCCLSSLLYKMLTLN